jgi:hypothetical protein
VDPVDRPKLGQPHLLGRVLEVNEHGQYLVGTRAGRLQHRYARNQLEPCENELILANEIPDKETSFRAAVGAASISGVQGNKSNFTRKFI